MLSGADEEEKGRRRRRRRVEEGEKALVTSPKGAGRRCGREGGEK